LISVCFQLLTAKPDDAQTWCNLADAYAARCKYDDAIASYEKAIALKPNYVVAWNNLGNVHHLQGQYDRQSKRTRKRSLSTRETPRRGSGSASLTRNGQADRSV